MVKELDERELQPNSTIEQHFIQYTVRASRLASGERERSTACTSSHVIAAARIESIASSKDTASKVIIVCVFGLSCNAIPDHD